MVVGLGVALVVIGLLTTEPLPDAKRSPAGHGEPPVSAGGQAQPHEWGLHAVTHEDFRAVEEYRCRICGDVVFRDA
jgi:hypothetical protein